MLDITNDEYKLGFDEKIKELSPKVDTNNGEKI